VRYLLDTAILLWSLNEPERLNDSVQDILAKGSEEVYLSAVSAWEIVIKSSLGKLRLPNPPERYVPSRMSALGLRPLNITHPHALAVSGLPSYHQDPFDRLLIAQARSEDMILMTTDHVFAKYAVQTLWCGK
jgi:PIN domain nuclease of toxin-antitoxin system